MSVGNQRSRFLSGRSGAAGAEFALLLPFLGLVLFGTIEFGRLFYNYDVVAKGVRDAARYLSRVPAGACAGGSWAPSSGTAVAETQHMATSGAPSGGTLRLASFTDGTVSVSTPCVANANALSGVYGGAANIRLAVVTAAVTYTFQFGDYVIPGVTTLTMTAVHRVPHVGE